jgi:hypothetical protein
MACGDNDLAAIAERVSFSKTVEAQFDAEQAKTDRLLLGVFSRTSPTPSPAAWSI